MIEPFRIEVAEEVLSDLRQRLARTRWPAPSPREPWAQGSELDYVRSLCATWAGSFDWRAQERMLNGFPQFTWTATGARLHFVHERSPHREALPLILLHGWPGSIYEFYKLIPLLTQPERHGGDPRDAFHVVAPSLPGYGWSDPPPAEAASPRAFGRLFARLMERLGYPSFGVQGGDWGAEIGSWLAFDSPEQVAALHLNMAALRPYTGPGAPPLSAEEQEFLARRKRILDDRFGYFMIQSTRPQSLAFGLSDSPAGWAGWIVEKFRDWSDCGGEIESAFTRDEILANLTIYWVTGTIASSLRLYYEYRRARDRLNAGQRVNVPTGFADFPGEIMRTPRSWLERAYQLVRFQHMPRGGHFAALEQPQLLAQDMREFFRGYRARRRGAGPSAER